MNNSSRTSKGIPYENKEGKPKEIVKNIDQTNHLLEVEFERIMTESVIGKAKKSSRQGRRTVTNRKKIPFCCFVSPTPVFSPQTAKVIELGDPGKVINITYRFRNT